ncbi:hypothetical protein E2F47_03470 [Mycobacterium eburneum]|nr:hypothetical protein [Mycobacterium eburneum]TDH57226.1 hypothetical protein E2F47_03470 [Mycobacterium eburneum]
MTRTRVGWVLVEGHDADGVTLDHDEFTVRAGRGVRAVDTAEQTMAAVWQTQALVDKRDQRLHAIGMTWSDEAAADAALLLESLTDAGFDHVVPIRFADAAEALTRGIGPVIGSERTAVCLIEDDAATVVMVEDGGAGARTAVKQPIDDNGLIRWLTTLFDRANWHPDGLVLAGSGTSTNLDAITRRLEKSLGIPVFAQSGAQLAVARGTALAAAPGDGEFTNARFVAPRRGPAAAPRRSLSYAGGVTMLVAGAVTFVASASLALGLRFAPEHGPTSVDQVTHTSSTPSVAEAATPPRPPRAAAVRAPAHPPAAEPEDAPIAAHDEDESTP